MSFRLIKFEHSSFLFQSPKTRIAIDFGSLTSDHSVNAVGRTDATIVSHVHPDHFNPAHLERLGGTVYGALEVIEALKSSGKGAHHVSPGAEFKIGEFNITALPADHGPKLTKPVENLGFLISTNNRSIYFAGDVARDVGNHVPPADVVLLPVDFSGFVFDPEQATEFLHRIGHRGFVVPMHFPINDRRAVERFKILTAGSCDVRVLQPGEWMEV